MAETVIAANVDQATANLNETVTTLEVKTKGKVKRLDGRYVLIFDPVTGKTLGASDFLSKTTSTFQVQADSTIAQANPVSTTLYPVLAATTNVRIYGIEVDVTWTVQPTPLDIVMVIDGVTITFTVANPVSTTKYYATVSMATAATAQLLETTDRFSTGRAFLIEGRSVAISARTTGGTTSALNARVKWAKK
jgi:hypothetical protein